MIRIALFLITNMAVMFLFGLILLLTGIKKDSLVALILFSGIFGFLGSFISLFMSKWIALNSVRAKIIKEVNNETEKWLINTVVFQSLKLGIKKPDVAIYHAPDINAFATGFNKNSSLVAVSSGLLESMNQDEVEAVIAHEMSHIANGDMVTMTLLQGIINTFVVFISRIIAQLFSEFLSEKTSERGNNNQGNFLIYNIVSFILEIVFGFLATIITMWFSRYREFKADAGSASLVGKEKMIAALERLKVSYEPQETSSIISLCINGRFDSYNDLFLSHPTIDNRIKALNLEIYMKK